MGNPCACVIVVHQKWGAAATSAEGGGRERDWLGRFLPLLFLLRGLPPAPTSQDIFSLSPLPDGGGGN